MPGVFINYRVEDEAYAAALIDSELSAWFGPDNVFRASRSIHPGDDYPRELLDNLRRCSVLLAVIGPEWLGTVDRDGRPRLEQPDDWVRREIAEAFEQEIRVIPILVADSPLPAEEELPADIARLARCQYLRLHHRNVPHDIARLVDELAERVPDLAAAREALQRSVDPTASWRPGSPAPALLRHRAADWRAEPAVTVLHLPGPRFRRAPVPAAAIAADAMGSPLLDDLFQLRDQHGLTPQLVLVSGDLVEHGMPSEFTAFAEFAAELSGKLAVPAERFVVVPGDHDVNRQACAAYVQRCAAEERAAEPPYVPKWDAFRELVGRLYPDQPATTFPPDQPWALFELPDLGVAVAALNSTIADSHRAQDNVGLLGQQQLAWFAERMRDLEQYGWLRIGLLHDDPAGGPGDRRLRDADDFTRLLAPHLQLVLHRHGPGWPHRRLPPAGPPLLGLDEADSAAGASHYQLVRIRRDRLEVWDRRYDPGARRWLADGSADGRAADGRAADGRAADGRSADGGGRREIAAVFERSHRVFTPPLLGGRPVSWGGSGAQQPVRRDADDLLDRVAEVCRLRHGASALVEVVSTSAARYLRVTSRTGAVIRQFPVGVHAGPVTAEDVERFRGRVDAHYRASDPGVQSVLVYGGEPASDVLRACAAAHGVQLVSFPEFQGVYDLRPYAARQTAKLSDDWLYSSDLYIPQRFTVVGRTGGEQEDVLAALLGWLSDPDGHFVLVLGDFGVGKTFLLRELVRRMHAETRHVVPVLVELRALEKAHSLDEVIASHLAFAGEQHIDLEKFRYLLRQGRVALLFDGFDELALRVTYDRAAEHLNTLLQAVEGRAKVVLTSRTQHFLSDEQVITALGDRVAMSAGRKLVKLHGFDDTQVVALLTKLLGGDEVRARSRFELLGEVRDLLGLSRNPRMLGLIAALGERRIRQAQQRHGSITAAVLYRELLDHWLEHEYGRAQPRGSAPTLSSEERWTAVTQLALRLWASTEPTLGVEDLQDVAAALRNLTTRQLDAPRAAHLIGSGTLLVRTEGGRFCFAHQSVQEWLVAADAAARLRAGQAPFGGRGQRQLSPLLAEFFADLAGREAVNDWARAVLADREADDTAKANALLVLGQAGGRTAATVQLAGRDLRGADLTGRVLAGANLAGADLSDTLLVGTDLSGADLRDAQLGGTRMERATLAGADLRAADLRGARLLGADLRGAKVDGGRWHRCALIGAHLDERTLDRCDTRAAALPGAAVEPQLRPAPGRYHAVALDPVAGLLVTGGGDGSVGLWDAGSGQPLRTLRGHASPVSAVAISPDGAALATASTDGRVCLWSMADGRLVRVVTSHMEPVTAVAFSPDGGRLATCGGDGTVCLWQPQSGEPVLIARDHAGPVTAIAFGRSGAVLATAGADGTVRLWDPVAGEPVAVLHGHSRAVRAVAFTVDETRLITASDDDTVRLWDQASRQPFHLVRLGGERALAFSPDGTRLASVGPEDGLHVWEPDFGNLYAVLKGHTGRLTAAAFSADGSRLVTAATDETARAWDPATGQPGATVRGRASAVTGLAFSTGGAGLVATDAQGATRVWDMAAGRCVGAVRGGSGGLVAIAASRLGLRIAADDGDEVHISAPGTGLLARVPHGHSGRLTALAFDSDGSRLATAGTDHVGRVWDLATGQRVGVLHGHIGAVTAAAFGPDGTTLATASTDDTIRLWDTLTGEPIRILHRRAGATTMVAFSADGRWLAAGSTDGTAQLWNAASGAEHGVLYGHTGRLTVVAFSPDGGWVATGSTDGTIRLWDPATGQTKHTLQADSGWIEAAAFSPDGTRLATGGTDGTVRLWEVADGGWLATLIPLAEGWGALLPGLKYKLEGLTAGEFWFTAGMCRFEPGELDPYHGELDRLPPDAPLRTVPATGTDLAGGPVARLREPALDD